MQVSLLSPDFFSKDEILANAFIHNKFVYGLAVVVSLLTAFYMFRLFFLTFAGTTRASEEVKHHIHESPKSMTIPLMVLAVLSLLGGFIGVPEVLGGGHTLNQFMSPVFAKANELARAHEHLNHSTELVLMALIVGLTAIVIFLAYSLYVKRNRVPAPDSITLGGFHKLLRNKYYVDEVYETIVMKTAPVYFQSI